jgi:hypothetical protein
MVAGTADGADGVVGPVLAHGRYPDGPRSQPPLAAEDDLNPERAKRGPRRTAAHPILKSGSSRKASARKVRRIYANPSE